MFLLHRPGEAQVRQFLAGQQAAPFSYQRIGVTRGAPPAGWTMDHNRGALGHGAAAWARAQAALRRWEMFHLGWVRLYWPDTPIAVGASVAVVAAHAGFWSLNACRIVYLVAETGAVERFGFAYGTLPQHAERGEERFTVEWHHADDSVWYDVLAVSQPQAALVRVGYPVARLLQRRFARDSKRAMVRAVQGPGL